MSNSATPSKIAPAGARMLARADAGAHRYLNGGGRCAADQSSKDVFIRAKQGEDEAVTRRRVQSQKGGREPVPTEPLSPCSVRVGGREIQIGVVANAAPSGRREDGGNRVREACKAGGSSAIAAGGNSVGAGTALVVSFEGGVGPRRA